MAQLSVTDLLLLFVVAGCTSASLAFVLLRRQLKELHNAIDNLQAKLEERGKCNDKRVDQLSTNVANLITLVEESSRRLSRTSLNSFTSIASSDGSARISPPATPERRSRVSVVLPTTPDLTGSGGSPEGDQMSRRPSPAEVVYGQHLLTRHIELGNFIGEGAFGAVHKGRWRGVPVALKFLRGDDAKLIEDLCREASVLHEIDHPHVMRLYGVCTDDAELPSNWPKRYNLKPPMLVCELMTEGNFVEFLLAAAPHREEKSRHWRRVAEMLEGAASGLEHLHSHGVVHRDLKALNLFVDGRGRLKIGDFGLAKMYAWNSHKRNSDFILHSDDDEENMEDVPAIGRGPGSMAIGTWTHQAPELMCFDGNSESVTYTPAVDIFSFAIVIIEALGANAAEELVDTTRVEIRRGKGQSPVFGIDIRGVHALLREEWHCSETNALLKIVESCGSLEPTMRPTASRLREYLSRVRFSSVHLELQLKSRSQRKLTGSPKSPFPP